MGDSPARARRSSACSRASGSRRPTSGVSSAAARRSGSAGLEPTVGVSALQQLPVEGLQEWAGRGAELFAQQRARVLERPQRVGDVTAGPQHRDQGRACGLAERRRLDRRAGGLLGVRELRAPDPRAAGRDHFQQLDPQVLELAALLVDPARLEARQQPAVGDLQRGARRDPRVRPAFGGDRGVCLPHADERRFPVHPVAGGRARESSPRPFSRPGPSALRRRDSGADSTASALCGADSPDHSTSSSSSRRTVRSRCRTR